MKTRLITTILVFAFSPLLMTTSILAQQAWTLQDCIDHAMRHNLEIKLQELNEESGRYDVEQSYANFLPNLNAEASQGLSYGRSVDPFTNEFSTEKIMRQNAGASTSVILFAGFQNVNYMRRNILRHTALRHDTERMKNDITLSIAAAFMQILYNEDFVETAQQQVELISQQLERTRILYEGGTVPRGSLLEIEARLAEEKVNLVNAENNLRLSYLELIQLLDLDPADEFVVVRPEMEITDQVVLRDPAAAYKKALQIEPGVQAAFSRIHMAEKFLAQERGRRSPVLALIGSIGTGYSQANQQLVRQESLGSVQIGYLADNTPVFTDGFRNIFETKPYNDQIRDNFSQYVGLNLRIPVFNRWEVRTRVQQSKVELNRARNEYELTRNNLNKTIQQAHADAIAAYQKYQATTKSLDSYLEAFNYTRQRFDLGMVSSVEFNESQTRLARAERETLQARYDFIFKMKIMEFYMGEGFKL